eukprot:TRINITY_DN847_c0_g1_i1.p1 TRINITY_DN847_c0_g1~~TRINITY_DN847_c0_g1_i1.p1  ORF type:complete len:599 (+),score=91.61 TRINITY_DN847_c0_g1_i1:94-1797(+)
MSRSVEVNPGNVIHIFGDIKESDELELKTAFENVGGFSGFKVQGKGRKKFSAALYRRESTFDYRLRPAAAMLHLLGRVSDCAMTLEGIPDVVLPQSLSELAKGDGTITVDASSMSKAISAMPTADPSASIGEVDPSTVWGDKKFTITHKELNTLEQSGRIVCDTDSFPTKFYVSLAKLTTKYISYYSTRRVQAIRSCGTAEKALEIIKLQEEGLKRTEEALQKLGTEKTEEDEDFEDWAYEYHKNKERINRFKGSLREDTDTIARIDSEHQQFVSDVLASPTAYGFKDADHCESTLSRSLNELSSSVCQTQKGYFMVSGIGEDMNQLCERTPTPVTFLSAAGIDFCTDVSTKIEGDKYFTISETWKPEQPLQSRYSGWKEGGADALYERVRSLYRCIFRSAQLQGVTHPCMLPMGLGVFLENVPDCCRSETKTAYFKAQLSLLKEDWGFTAYCINAGPPALVQFFKDIMSGFDTRELKCPIVLHSRDVKFLAVSLASRNLSPGYLNPSDAIAVLQGLIGYYWEIGKGSSYVGEEDFAATSTAVLSRVNISNLHIDPTRVVPAHHSGD